MNQTLKDEIKREEARNEVLTSAVLVGFCSFFLGVYLISPRGFSEQQWFEAVPIVFSVYLPFCILRLVAAHYRKIRDYQLTLFCVADVTLISTLIWLWHIQYNQPAPFYLKVPTFSAFYLMLSLRSLSYRPFYMLLTGLTAMFEWTVLVIYAFATESHLVTRSFVDYMTGANILFGAEIEKLLTLGIVTGVLTMSIYRARKMLVKSVEESFHGLQLSKFFSPEVSRKIRTAAAPAKPGTGESRQAAILTIDLRGFTALCSKLSPNDVIKLVTEYQTRMVGCIFRHGGCIDKFMGDGILAHFGAASDSKTYAADCVKTMLLMAEEVHRWNAERTANGLAPLRIGMAAASGSVIFGVVGDVDRLEFTTIGDPVNLAAKIEKHTKRAGVMALTTGELYEAALNQGLTVAFKPERLNGSTVDGVKTPVDLVVVSRNSDAIERPQAA